MKDFLDELHRRHQQAADHAFPATPSVKDFTQNLVNWLFPEHTGRVLTAYDVLAEYATSLQTQLQHLLEPMQASLKAPAATVAQTFMDRVPQIYADLNKDAEAVLLGDPAATCLYEVIRTYPGFYAIAFYRIAHCLYKLQVPLLPRIITELAHAQTGVDIHPAAVIGPYCCIDHGTGVVIGETTVIGEHVKIYQGVTLGALSIEKEMAQSKRHPTIEDHVVIYAGATILGGDTVIGHHSIIGGNVWLIKSIEPFSRIYYRADGTMVAR